ncbi:hypothetical protein QQX98_008590 [Neonectria punicea]|uniref:Zn(2)-C6 fungal-type domain-containing protein n=1 Tax=Neonectria punicea TaxID=979145 RepID=A0ABR1GUV9_9HYPO
MTSPMENPPAPIQATTPVSQVSAVSSNRPKRASELSPDAASDSSNRRKTAKVSRAYDHCKLKKLKCSGAIPCSSCTKKSIPCQYDAQYRRGRPPTPPAAVSPAEAPQNSRRSCTASRPNEQRAPNRADKTNDSSRSRPTSRDYPGLETAEIEGQIFDPTSNLTFIHRAWKRLALQKRDTRPNVLTGSEHSQPLMSAGDKPFTTPQGQDLIFMDQETSVELFKFYFDNCIVTYRALNEQICFFHAKAAIVVNILAIASLRKHKISAPMSIDTEESFALRQSEQYFTTSINLTAGETGLPRVESAQARVLQVLYLLQTSRMNQAWVARIIENISREVYSLKPMANNERLAAAQRFTRQLHEWREELPPYLGTVRPSSLIPSFGRQATALKLAYCHAIMHANRPFLLDHSGDPGQTAMRESVTECIGAAKMALETVDRMFSDGAVLFHSLWWMPYVTFCALAVVYVWEIKQKANGVTEMEDPALFTLSEQCQCHLAQAISSESASRRYSIIIEELRIEARHSSAPILLRQQMSDQPQEQETVMVDDSGERVLDSMTDDLGFMFEDQGEGHFQSMLNPLSQWQATDWLDLDSSAFGFFSELESTLIL